MKFAFVILGIVACVIAQEIPYKMCSVSGSGSAVIAISGRPETYTAEMIRVGDTARYLIKDKDTTIASIYVRPDVEKGKTYLLYTKQGFMSIGCLKLSEYTYDGECFSTQVDNVKARMCFEKEELKTENFIIPLSKDLTMDVTINYKDVDYDYVHNEVDDAFSCQDVSDIAVCKDEESKTKAEHALTSEVCGSPIPEEMCSVSALGTAKIEGFDDPAYSCEMIRVGDTARYLVLDDKTPVASIYVRPDIEKGKTYLLHHKAGYMAIGCLKLSEYTFDGECFSTEVDNVKAHMCFEKDGLKSEKFEIVINKELTMNITIDYEKVDYEYVHNEVDDAFSCIDINENAICKDEESKTKAEHALTSEECGGSNSNSNSNSGTGSGTGSGSVSDPKDICSVSSEFSAVVSYREKEYQYTGQMFRVGDTAKYLMADGLKPATSIYIRPDIGKSGHTFLLSNILESTSSFSFVCLRLSDYEYDSKSGCFKKDSDSIKGQLCFDENGDLKTEIFNFTMGKDVLGVFIAHKTVNYDYTHDIEDNEFSCVDIGKIECSSDAKTNATQAITADICGSSNSDSNSKSTSKSNSGSDSNTGSESGRSSTGSAGSTTGSTGSGSTGSGSHGSKKSTSSGGIQSSASFTLPSALLFLVAVILVLF